VWDCVLPVRCLVLGDPEGLLGGVRESSAWDAFRSSHSVARRPIGDASAARFRPDLGGVLSPPRPLSPITSCKSPVISPDRLVPQSASGLYVLKEEWRGCIVR
jgi:hypothetical protein